MSKNLSLIPLLLLLSGRVLLFGQDPSVDANPPLASALDAVKLPTSIIGFLAFNQLGTPRLTGGFSAIYPLPSRIGIYASSTADVYPKFSQDPQTGKSFYALSSTIRQGLHKDLLDSGRFSFLLGGDLGPGFSQGIPSGISVSLSGSFVSTIVYHASELIGIVLPVRMLYIRDIGFNPVVEIGILIRLDKLPKGHK